MCHESRPADKIYQARTVTKNPSISLRGFQDKDAQTAPKCSVTKAAVKLKVPLLALPCCPFKRTTKPQLSMVPLSQTASCATAGPHYLLRQDLRAIWAL